MEEKCICMSERERERERENNSVCISFRERERKKERERERKKKCFYKFERERERESERENKSVCISFREREIKKRKILLLLLRSNPRRQHSKIYCWGVRRRGKTGKHGKVEVKRNWSVLAQPPYSPQGNGKQSSRVEPFNQGDRPPDTKESPGSWYFQRLVITKIL